MNMALGQQPEGDPVANPDFSAARYEGALRRIDAVIQETGHFVTKAHRFLIQAQKL